MADNVAQAHLDLVGVCAATLVQDLKDVVLGTRQVFHAAIVSAFYGLVQLLSLCSP